MMTIKSIGKANTAKHYFEKDNYYAKGEGIEKSQWQGKGALKLGLEGIVDSNDFSKVLHGELGETQLGRKNGKNVEHRSGWDCTFSAPKSVSIIGLAYQDETVIKAHQKAVSYAVTFLENNAAQFRKRIDGSIIKHESDNLLVASFLHDTSRELDPQLHTHCVVLNATHTGADGWRSLSSENLYKLQKKAGLIYRNELARQVQLLGYNLTRKEQGFFEVEGISDNLLSEFSERRKQILSYIEDNNLSYNAKTAQKATLATRANKADVDRDDLYKSWAAVVKDLPLPDISENKQFIPLENIKVLARKSIQHLALKEMSFSRDDILDHILKYSVGEYSDQAILNEVTRQIEEQHLLPADPCPITNVERFTTLEGQRIEQDVVNSIHGGFHNIKPILNNTESLEKAYKKSFLNDEQANAIIKFSKSGDRFFGIQGVAGSGKTTILNEIKKIALENKFELLALAPTHQAVKELENSLSLKVKTLSSVLYTRNFDAQKTNKLALGETPNNKKIWVVDESSFPSAKDMRRLLRFASKLDTRILFVGDKAQLESIEAGQAYALMQDAGLDIAVIKKNVRQMDAEPELKETVDFINNSQFSEAIDRLAPSVHEEKNEDERAQQLVSSWAAYSKEDRENVLVLTPSNDERKIVNNLMREQLKSEDVLKHEDTTLRSFENRYFDRFETRYVLKYKTNDVVRFNREYKGGGGREKIAKNEYFDVVSVNQKKNILGLKSHLDGRYINVNPNRQGGNKKGGLEVFKPMDLHCQSGDKIRWNDNSNNLALKRNSTLTIKAIQNDVIRCASESGKEILLDRSNLSNQHFTYDYASTVYAAQGKNCDHVLALADSQRSNLVNQKSFLVEVTRAKKSAMIFTDDFNKLKDVLIERTGENSRALKNIVVKKQTVIKKAKTIEI